MLRKSVLIVCVAALYFLGAKAGLSLAFVAEQVSVVWPPTGIGLAALLLFGLETWPGIFFGAFIVNALANEPLLTALGIAIGNTLEAYVGAQLLYRLPGFRSDLSRMKDVIF